jgi:hypothetical protein
VLSEDALAWLGSLAHAQTPHTGGLWERRGMARYLVAQVSQFASETEETRRHAKQLVDAIEGHASSMLRAFGQHPFMTRYHRQAGSDTRPLQVRLCTLELHRVLKGGYSAPSFSAGARSGRGGDGLMGGVMGGGDHDDGLGPDAGGSRKHADADADAPSPPCAAPAACPKGLRHLAGFIFVNGRGQESGQAGAGGDAGHDASHAAGHDASHAAAATALAPDGVQLMDPRILRTSPSMVHTVEPQPGMLVIFPSLVQFYVQSARSQLAAVYFELLVHESQ